MFCSCMYCGSSTCCGHELVNVRVGGVRRVSWRERWRGQIVLRCAFYSRTVGLLSFVATSILLNFYKVFVSQFSLAGTIVHGCPWFRRGSVFVLQLSRRRERVSREFDSQYSGNPLDSYVVDHVAILRVKVIQVGRRRWHEVPPPGRVIDEMH